MVRASGGHTGQAESALRTFSFGLFLKQDEECVSAGRSGPQDELFVPPGVRWECVAEPAEITGGDRLGFTTLACGHSCCLGITPEGGVHRWDAGREGAGALSKSFGMEWSLSVLRGAESVLQLRDASLARMDLRDSLAVAGEAIVAVALMDSGDVYTAAVDALGEDLPLSPAWRPVPSLQPLRVTSVACGGGFCIALTAHGELWTWGQMSHGAGGSDAASQVHTPALVHGGLDGLKVAAVACGDQHAVAVTCDVVNTPGAVFSWGCTRDERLGYVSDSLELQLEPRQVPWITSALEDALLGRHEASPLDTSTEPNRHGTSGRSRSTLTPQRITHLACGSRHTVLLCQGSLICFGANDHGQLGQFTGGGSVDNEELPTLASAPVLLFWPDADPIAGDDPPPSHISDNDDHGDDCAECIDDTGVSIGEVTAKLLCCGPLHTAVVSTDGHLFTWGLELTRIPSQVSTPRHVDGVRRIYGFGPRRPAVALACGAHFVLVSAEVELPFVDAPSQAIESLAPLLGSDGQPGGQTAWRQANLPPKSEDEASRHEGLVRELERSVQRRARLERQEGQERREREARRELRLREHSEAWLKELLPKFVPGSKPSKRTERLWRQGLPPRVREALWPIAIGNVLRITPDLYEIHRRRALDARTCGSTPSHMLVQDLPRTFPNLAFFCAGGPLHEDCSQILEAYTYFRPDIGYVQGMTFLAAMLLLYLPPYPAFVGLCNLLNSPSVLGLYRLEPRAVECRAGVFHRLCSGQLPAVAFRLQDLDLRPEMYLIDWFMTLYAKCLAIDVAAVVWDLFLLDGEVVLYCTAIALLRVAEEALLSEAGSDLEGCARILREHIRERVVDPDELLWHIHEVWRRAPRELITEIRDIENVEFSSIACPRRSSSDVGSSSSQRTLLTALQGTRLSRWMSR